MFTTLFWRLNVDKTFTNHNFHVGLHVTFGLNDRRFPIHMGEANKLSIARWINVGEATGHWHVVFLFDTLCQLAYMIYVKKRKCKNCYFKHTAGYRGYRLFVAHVSQESVTTLPRPPSRLGMGWNLGSWFSEKTSLKCCHQMPDLNAQMHQNRLRLRLCHTPGGELIALPQTPRHPIIEYNRA